MTIEQIEKKVKELSRRVCCISASGDRFGVTGEDVLATSDRNFNLSGFNLELSNGKIGLDEENGEPYYITMREIGIAFPVPTLIPKGDNKNIAFDIMPKGSPGNHSDNGIAWMDVCDTECLTTNPPIGAARVGITSTAVQFGSRAFNGASIKPVEFIVQTDKRITLNTNNTADFNIGKITQSQNLSGDYVGYSIFNTNNTTIGGDSILFIGQSIAGLNHGFLRYSNNASGTLGSQMPNSFQIASNANAIGGLNIAALSNVAAIRFFIGGSGGIEVMRMDSARSVGIGATSIDNSAKLQIDSTTKGFLPPRMTGVQIEAILAPAEGLLAYSTDGSGVTINSKGWWGYDGTNWLKLNP